MSRRVRTKMRRQPMQMGLSHHTQYSSSSTHFPQSYSIFGSPISIPSKVLPLYHDNKINYIFGEGELMDQSSVFYTLGSDQFRQAEEVNLTVVGKIIRPHRSLITTLLFVLTMAMCCLGAIFKMRAFRKKFYTRYKISQDEYIRLATVLSQLQKCRLLILNVQDNQMNEEKTKILENALLEMTENSTIENGFSSENFSPRISIVIRNSCYYMKEIELNKQFRKLAQQDSIQICLVWEDQVAKLASARCENSERAALMNSVLNC